MENTAESMYKYFLQLIRKERTTTVSPDKWNEWINSTLLNWVKTKLPEQEFVQKRIDDLEALYERYDQSGMPPKEWDLPSDYLHGIYAEFMIPGTSDYLPGKILRSDNRTVYKQNPFRDNSDNTYVYFELREGTIYAVDDISYETIGLGYYKLPLQIIYDPNGSSTAGSFRLSQNQEVVELAARKYLERITDPRHQSFSMEQMSTPS